MSKEYLIKEETLVNIANAIRNKTGDTNTIKAIDMADKIENLNINKFIGTCHIHIETNSSDAKIFYISLSENGEFILNSEVIPGSSSLNFTAVCGTIISVFLTDASDGTSSNDLWEYIYKVNSYDFILQVSLIEDTYLECSFSDSGIF